LSIAFKVYHMTKCVPSPHILAWTLPAMRHRRRRCQIPQMPSNFHHHHPYGQRATCSRIQSIATSWETLIFLVLVKVQLQCGLQFSQGSVETPETDSGSAGLSGKRPRGRDYSKAERKKVGSSSSPEYLSRLQEITEKQIQRSIEKGKKEKTTEEDMEIQKKRLDLEAQKLSIRQRELKLEELKSAEQRLQMLLSTNEEDVDPEVWVVMKEQKKNCSSSYLLLSNHERFSSMCACAVETC
jgi:hypothetical protein